MKLEKFKTDRSKKIRNILLILGAIIILVGGIIFYRSYAIYEEDKTFNIIRGQVPEFSSSDIQMAYTIDGEKASSFPTSTSNYKVVVDCGDTATGKWDYKEWAAVIKNISNEKVKCSISFTSLTDSFADFIFLLATTDTTNLVSDDETADHNTRYIGANPNNYLCFDKNCTNGKWRIIGVMNNMTTASKGTQNLVKIIRADSVGTYAWNSNNENDWTTATLQTNLNSGELYTTYIKDYNNLFETVTWNLGGVKYNEWTPSNLYKFERGDLGYNDRPTEWTGKIGLMYASDYGFATSGGTTGRTACLSYEVWNWGSYSDCYDNNYLLDSTYWQWTITSRYDVSNYTLDVHRAGMLSNYYPRELYVVHPVGYLVSNAKILSGDGTSSSPWIISA